MSAAEMRQRTMINVRANQLPVTGDFWLFLAFRSDTELRAICYEMHITAGAAS
jgi:hypothetical protein